MTMGNSSCIAFDAHKMHLDNVQSKTEKKKAKNAIMIEVNAAHISILYHIFMTLCLEVHINNACSKLQFSIITIFMVPHGGF